tara:strand:+ start:624 stop:1520 length:897 start_codon:yes stop_codon:yes gene_type:complete
MKNNLNRVGKGIAIFILVLILIYLYLDIVNNYELNNKLNNKNNLEGYQQKKDSPFKEIMGTENLSDTVTDVLDAKLESLNTLDMNKELFIKDRKNELIAKLKMFNNLDIPIIMNNNGVICESWDSKDDGNNYKGNECQKVGSDHKCYQNNNLVSCNKYYTSVIKDLSKLNVNEIINSEFSDMSESIININQKFDFIKERINRTVNDIIKYNNTKNQQEYFIKNNNIYIHEFSSKDNNIKKEMEEENENYEKNRKKLEYYIKDRKNIEKKYNIYKKVFTGLVIAFSILIIINILFSEAN